jgi:hypothetical protein
MSVDGMKSVQSDLSNTSSTSRTIAGRRLIEGERVAVLRYLSPMVPSHVSKATTKNEAGSFRPQRDSRGVGPRC